MPTNDFTDAAIKDARRRVPRTRGATSGLLLLLLGLWGALIPLLGPIVHFGLAPDKTFKFTTGRFWLEILPGVVVIVGALLLMGLASRVVTSLGAWLAVAGGAWFIVGNNLRALLHLGTLGAPLQKTKAGVALDSLLLLDGLGALILFLGALALGRLGVVSVRDVRAASRRSAKAVNERGDDNDRTNDARENDSYREDRIERRAVHRTEPLQTTDIDQTRRIPTVDDTVVDAPRGGSTGTDDTVVDAPRGSTGTGGATRLNEDDSR